MNHEDLLEDARTVLAAAAQAAARRGYEGAEHGTATLTILAFAASRLATDALLGPDEDPDPKDREPAPASRPNNVVPIELARLKRAA